MHDNAINLTGGARGILNIHRIEDCLDKMSNYFGLESFDDLYAMAASLLECLITSHGFADGNKRTAISAVQQLLENNGIDFQPNDRTKDLCLVIAQNKHSMDDVRGWIRTCSTTK